MKVIVPTVLNKAYGHLFTRSTYFISTIDFYLKNIRMFSEIQDLRSFYLGPTF